MLIIMFADFVNPSNLKTFDERFEIQLPLKNAKINFNTKVCIVNVNYIAICLQLCNNCNLVHRNTKA